MLVDKNTVGAEDITFAYCRFEAETSFHKKPIHKDAEEGYLYTVGERY